MWAALAAHHLSSSRHTTLRVTAWQEQVDRHLSCDLSRGQYEAAQHLVFDHLNTIYSIYLNLFLQYSPERRGFWSISIARKRWRSILHSRRSSRTPGLPWQSQQDSSEMERYSNVTDSVTVVDSSQLNCWVSDNISTSCWHLLMQMVRFCKLRFVVDLHMKLWDPGF